MTAKLPAGLPVALAHAAHASVGAAFTTAAQIRAGGHLALASALHNVASSAFFSGFHAGDFVAAGVAGAGAAMALALLPAHPTLIAPSTQAEAARALVA